MRTQSSYEQPKRRSLALVWLVVLVGAAATPALAGAARTPCGVQVLDDWYGSKTGQLSKTYPLHCYRDALNFVTSQPDFDLYSNAPQDITRAMALAAAAHGLKSPPSGGLPSFRGGPDARSGGHAPRVTRFGVLADPGPRLLGSSTASAVPLPTIVLAAIAALLLALGVLGYRARPQRLP